MTKISIFDRKFDFRQKFSENRKLELQLQIFKNKFLEIRRKRNESIKRKLDGSAVSARWNPPPENPMASSILVGCWAEGLEGNV